MFTSTDCTPSKKKHIDDKDESVCVSLIIKDNIFVLFSGRELQQTIGIPMGMNCAPLLADLFLHAYDANFLQGPLMYKNRTLA
jgi:hypothetical protein